MAHTEEALHALAPEDAEELARIVDGAHRMAALSSPVERAPELSSVGDHLRDVWRLRHDLGPLVHFRKPVGVWVDEHLKSPRMRGLFQRLMPPETPMLFLLMVFGYLARGWLSRPVGGTSRFRDALIDRYRTLGGEVVMNTTVEEILVSNDRARGVRLTDGTMIDGDVVVSTASAPETVFRLLAGRYGASAWKERVDHWKMFQPIVLASFGISRSFEGHPSTLLIDGIACAAIGRPFTPGVTRGSSGHR